MRPRKSVALFQCRNFVALHTGKYLQALEMLIGMHVARRKGKVDPDQQEEQICSSPHDSKQKPRVVAFLFYMRFERYLLLEYLYVGA